MGKVGEMGRDPEEWRSAALGDVGTLQNALGQNRGGWGGEQTGGESPAVPFTSCPDWPGGRLRKILPFRSAGREETRQPLWPLPPLSDPVPETGDPPLVPEVWPRPRGPSALCKDRL